MCSLLITCSTPAISTHLLPSQQGVHSLQVHYGPISSTRVIPSLFPECRSHTRFFTRQLFAIGSKKAGGAEGSGSGTTYIYKIPDGDCMFKHSSGAEHTTQLLWIFGSSLCSHPSWSISGWHCGRKDWQKNVWHRQKVDTRANWYEQARKKYRLGMRRQLLGSRGVMFWNKLSMMMPT